MVEPLHEHSTPHQSPTHGGTNAKQRREQISLSDRYHSAELRVDKSFDLYRHLGGSLYCVFQEELQLQNAKMEKMEKERKELTLNTDKLESRVSLILEQVFKKLNKYEYKHK